MASDMEKYSKRGAGSRKWLRTGKDVWHATVKPPKWGLKKESWGRTKSNGWTSKSKKEY